MCSENLGEVEQITSRLAAKQAVEGQQHKSDLRCGDVISSLPQVSNEPHEMPYIVPIAPESRHCAVDLQADSTPAAHVFEKQAKCEESCNSTVEEETFHNDSITPSLSSETVSEEEAYQPASLNQSTTPEETPDPVCSCCGISPNGDDYTHVKDLQASQINAQETSQTEGSTSSISSLSEDEEGSVSTDLPSHISDLDVPGALDIQTDQPDDGARNCHLPNFFQPPNDIQENMRALRMRALSQLPPEKSLEPETSTKQVRDRNQSSLMSTPDRLEQSLEQLLRNYRQKADSRKYVKELSENETNRIAKIFKGHSSL